MIDATVLDLLVCPLTHQPLRVASPEMLTRLQLDAAFLREDGQVAYPIREGIPVLIAEEAIALDPPAN